MVEIPLLPDGIIYVSPEDEEYVSKNTWMETRIGIMNTNMHELLGDVVIDRKIEEGDWSGVTGEIIHRIEWWLDMNRTYGSGLECPGVEHYHIDGDQNNFCRYNIGQRLSTFTTLQDKGLSWCEDKQTWEVWKWKNNKKKHLGYDDDFEVAYVFYHR